MKIRVKFYLQCSFLSLILLAHNVNVIAQDSALGKWMVNARINYGFVMAHRPTVVQLQKKHVVGFEAELFRTSTGEKDFEQAYNRPLLGVGFQYWNLGNDRELGNSYGIFPQILFPINHSPHLLISGRLSCGIGYIEKTFDRLGNHKNVAISTNINCLISFGLYARAFVRKRTQIVTGLEFTHMSNGGFKVPNLGVNIPSVNIGLSHFLGEKKAFYPERSLPRPRSTIVNLLIAGGIKEIVPPGGKKHGALSFTGTISKSLSLKSSIGTGMDVLYDHSIETRLKGDSVNVRNFTYAMRSGIHVSYELKVQKLSILFENGFYLYNRYAGDGSIYTRLCLRYHFADRYFAVLNLKTHFAKADYWEYGIGMRLKTKSSTR